MEKIKYQDTIADFDRLQKIKQKMENVPGKFIYFYEEWAEDTGYNITKELTKKATGCIITDRELFEKIRIDGDEIFQNFDMNYSDNLICVI